MNLVKFLWCYFLAGHKWGGGGDWSMCWRCKLLKRNPKEDHITVSERGIHFTGRRKQS